MNNAPQHPHCLTIAGSDPSGGAGIQGDLKTFTVLGAYGMAALTALTAQNTRGVTGVHVVPAEFAAEQIRTALDDVRCDAAKTGMLATGDIVRAVVRELRARGRDAGIDNPAPVKRGGSDSTPLPFPLVVDPVMVATSGARLLDEDAVDAIRMELLPLATLATPNAPEAEVLSGMAILTVEDAVEAARRISAAGPRAVLVKGGDFAVQSDEVTDVLFDGHDITILRARRIHTPHTHGSGCALAAAICVALARGTDLSAAVEFGRTYIRRAIETASMLHVGSGNGPVNHLGYTYQ